MKPYYEQSGVSVYLGDALAVLYELPDESVNCCVTSPPYWGLRDYGIAGQIGLEATPEQYVERMIDVFGEVRRVLRDDGTLWLNLGDCYASAWPAPNTRRNIVGNPMSDGKRGPQRPERMGPGLKEKDLVGIPWRVGFALQADGWWLRSEIIWHKPNTMPESVQDRPTKTHEQIFLLAKSEQYWYDSEAIKEPDSGQQHHRNIRNGAPSLEPSGGLRSPHGSLWKGLEANGCGRNKRDVWTINTDPFPEAHFATFPPALITPCILAGCPVGGTVLDPFSGAGTTALVAKKNGRRCIGIELNEDYVRMSVKRLSQEVLDFS